MDADGVVSVAELEEITGDVVPLLEGPAASEPMSPSAPPSPLSPTRQPWSRPHSPARGGSSPCASPRGVPVQGPSSPKVESVKGGSHHTEANSGKRFSLGLVERTVGWGSAMASSTIISLLHRSATSDKELTFEDFQRMVKEEWKLRSFYKSDIAQCGYLLAYKNSCFVINPSAEISSVLQALDEFGLSLNGILLTHLPVDYVSGHAELSACTGAPVYFGAQEFGVLETLPDSSLGRAATDDTKIPMADDFYFRPLATPGHTSGSVSWCLCALNSDDEDVLLVFTGSFLLNGGIARCDLEAKVSGDPRLQVQPDILRRSIQKIAALPSDTEIFPTACAGSLVFRPGEALLQTLRTTVKKQKRCNPGFRQAMKSSISFGEYMNWVSDSVDFPPYFKACYEANRQPWSERRILFDMDDPMVPQALRKAPSAFAVPKLDASAFHAASSNPGVVIVDARSAVAASRVFVKGALSVPLDTPETQVEDFWSIWLGMLLPEDPQLLLICEDRDLPDVLGRMQHIGCTEVVGALAMNAWYALAELGASRPGYGLASADGQVGVSVVDVVRDASIVVVDVRSEVEFHGADIGIFDNSISCCLRNMVKEKLWTNFDTKKKIMVVCNDGFRSAMAASYLIQEGMNVVVLHGGLESISRDPEVNHLLLHDDFS